MDKIGVYIAFLFCTGVAVAILFFIIGIVNSMIAYSDMPVYSTH